jgi:hypothetical protein
LIPKESLCSREIDLLWLGLRGEKHKMMDYVECRASNGGEEGFYDSDEILDVVNISNTSCGGDEIEEIQVLCEDGAGGFAHEGGSLCAENGGQSSLDFRLSLDHKMNTDQSLALPRSVSQSFSVDDFKLRQEFECDSCHHTHSLGCIGPYSGDLPLYGDEIATYRCGECGPDKLARFSFPSCRPWSAIAFVALVNLAIEVDGSSSPIDGTFHHLQTTVDNFVYTHFNSLCAGYTRNCWKSRLAAALNHLPSHFEHSPGQQGKGWWRVRYGAKYPTDQDIQSHIQQLQQQEQLVSPWGRRNRRGLHPPHLHPSHLPLPTSTAAVTAELLPPSSSSRNMKRQHQLSASKTREVRHHVDNKSSSYSYSSPSSSSSSPSMVVESSSPTRRRNLETDSSSSTELFDAHSTSSSNSTPRDDIDSNMSVQRTSVRKHRSESQIQRRRNLNRRSSIATRQGNATTTLEHMDVSFSSSSPATTTTTLADEWKLVKLGGQLAMNFVCRRLHNLTAEHFTASMIREYRLQFETGLAMCELAPSSINADNGISNSKFEPLEPVALSFNSNSSLPNRSSSIPRYSIDRNTTNAAAHVPLYTGNPGCTWGFSSLPNTMHSFVSIPHYMFPSFTGLAPHGNAWDQSR